MSSRNIWSEKTLLKQMAWLHSKVWDAFEFASEELATMDVDCPYRPDFNPYTAHICSIRDWRTVQKAAAKRCLRNFCAICEGKENSVVIKNADSFVEELGYRPFKEERAMKDYSSEYLKLSGFIKKHMKNFNDKRK